MIFDAEHFLCYANVQSLLSYFKKRFEYLVKNLVA